MRKIIHCDADCFFAAIEMRDNPRLRNVPMAIGESTSRRGVISTCNYEARRFGIHSAMPTWEAKSRCPDLILVSHRMEKYLEASRAMAAIFRSYTDVVEMVSIDEAYLDVTWDQHICPSATLLAKEIRSRIASEIGITVSAGVAPNKFLAKVASEWRKPDGLYVIPPKNVDAFMLDLPVKFIQGVGTKTAQKLHSQGIHTCGDLQLIQLKELIKQYGRLGVHLYEQARGLDNRPVSTARTRKSLSVEHTFEQDLSHQQGFDTALAHLFTRLTARMEKLRSHPVVTKIQAKVKFSNHLQTTLEEPASAPQVDAYARLLHEGWQRMKLPVRLLGIGVQFAVQDEHNSIQNQLELFPAADGPKRLYDHVLCRHATNRVGLG